jgi:hypothetical protein
MCHEMLHAKFFHICCNFVFEFAQIAEKGCDSFFERVQGRRLFSFHDGIAAAHLFRVSCRGGPRRDGQGVSGFVGITLRRSRNRRGYWLFRARRRRIAGDTTG